MDRLWKNPCKPDCPKRSMTCHGKCPEYKVWAYRHRKRVDQLWEEAKIDRTAYQRNLRCQEARLKFKKQKR